MCKLRGQATACGLWKTGISQCGWPEAACGRKRASEGDHAAGAGEAAGAGGWRAGKRGVYGTLMCTRALSLPLSEAGSASSQASAPSLSFQCHFVISGDPWTLCLSTSYLMSYWRAEMLQFAFFLFIQCYPSIVGPQ